MFLSGRNNPQPAPVSDAVYVEIIASLYGTVVPVLFAGIGLAIVGGIAARETGDALTAVLTALGVALSIIRTIDVFSYHRRVAGTRQTRADALVWEWRYGAGSVAMAFVIGLFAARSVMLGDGICSIMAIGLGLGFGAGVVSRLSLRPIIAILDLGVIGVPPIAAAFAQQFDAPHVGLGLLMTIYMVGSFEMVR